MCNRSGQGWIQQELNNSITKLAVALCGGCFYCPLSHKNTSSLFSSERFIGIDLHKHRSIKYKPKRVGEFRGIKTEVGGEVSLTPSGKRAVSLQVCLDRTWAVSLKSTRAEQGRGAGVNQEISLLHKHVPRLMRVSVQVSILIHHTV